MGVVCCQVEFSGTGRSPVQRSPTERGILEFSFQKPHKGSLSLLLLWIHEKKKLRNIYLAPHIFFQVFSEILTEGQTDGRMHIILRLQILRRIQIMHVSRFVGDKFVSIF